LAASFAALLLAAPGKMFHLSLPNLLRLVFGGRGNRAGSSSDVAAVCLSNETNFISTSVGDLVLTRSASAFSASLTSDDDEDGARITSDGFLWDEEDGRTTRWRPQGVTTFNADNGTRRFVLVSWYGRADEGYGDRGGRVSFVDVSRMQSRRRRDGTTTSTTAYYPYEHVLLVDERFCTLPSIHVGGIEHVNGTLYVADSRKDQHKILEFDLVGGLYDVSTGEGASDAFLGHRYVLRMSSSFRSPITPSFLSYDADRGEFVIGTYARCGDQKLGAHSMSDECFDRKENTLVWLKRGGDGGDDDDDDDADFAVDDGGGNATWGNATSGNATWGNATSGGSSSMGNFSRTAWHYFSEMQGAASATVGGSTVVWTSSSYGPIGDSHLHVVRAPPSSTIDLVKEEVNIFRFPPGLEDLHIERWTAGDRYMWMVTEFGTRRVFATRLEYLFC
jgi:hypothetical protein